LEYLRKVDFIGLEATDKRVNQSLLGPDSGATTCSVSCIKTPPGEGSPAGMHTHEVDQMFYVLLGTMTLEIAGDRYEAEAGTLVIFPAHTPHRNWNSGTKPTVHLAINSPVPDPGVPFAKPVD
jgi:quercetin dioxygenase-like cupin family protein